MVNEFGWYIILTSHNIFEEIIFLLQFYRLFLNYVQYSKWNTDTICVDVVLIPHSEFYVIGVRLIF